MHNGLLGPLGRYWSPLRFSFEITNRCNRWYKPNEMAVSECIMPHNISCGNSPQERCHCGIYGMRTLEDVKLVIKGMSLYGHLLVLGKVALWGKVIEHEKGYRAEFAYPQIFYYNDSDKEKIQELSRLWGIDACPTITATSLAI